MTFAHTVSAIRHHLFSILFNVAMVIASAILLHVSVALALAIWLAAGLASIELWYAVEPCVLRWLGGCRAPSYAERARLEPALGRSSLQLLIADAPDLAAVRGARCLVITRDLLEFLDDRALCGLLSQTADASNWANLAGFAFVWLGNLPLLGAWLAGRFVGQLGQLLGVAVGASLVLPLVFWRDGFLHWSGRLFGGMIGALLATMLLYAGFAAAGLGLLIAWALVPAIQTLLAWESRRSERGADQASIAAGFGPQLLEAMECLLLAEPLPHPAGLLGVLKCPGAPLVDRADRIRRVVSLPQIDQ
jgi:hypothetical protein